MSLNESIVEDAALAWFGELGYAVGHGPHPSCTLAILRNAWLPKRLSGELSVADAEEVVHHPERQTV
jgi:hypothetical protein